MDNLDLYKVNDVTLWNSFRMGNVHAFQCIYEKNMQILTNYGMRICADKEQVKDAIHDMFVDMWRNKMHLGHTNSIKHYLIKAVRRNLIKKIVEGRKKACEDITLLSNNLLFDLSHELEIIQSELQQEQINKLHQALQKLSSRQKEVLFLRFFGGFNSSEIADILDINPQSSYNLIHRSLATLRENMDYTAITPLLFLIAKLP